MPLKLRDLLKFTSYECLYGDLDVEIMGVVTDSRRVRSGDLFIALKGATVDGCDYLGQAAVQGAAAALVERQVEPEILKGFGCVVLVEGLHSRLAELGARFFQQPSEQMEVIGITGTNGKTSVAQMLGDALETLDERVGVFGTIGNRILDQRYETQNTTLEPIELQRHFRKAADAGVTRLVMEVSSHGLELGRVDHTRFSLAIFTNLTEDHLDFHPTMEAYFLAKSKLFEMNHGISAINLDDPYGQRLVERLRALKKPVLTYGLSEACDVRAKEVVWTPAGTRFDLVADQLELTVAVPGLGKFQVYNALAVFTALLALGYDGTQLLEASKGFRAVPGRMEHLVGQWPFDVFVDFAHTPDALKNILEISRELTRGRLWVLFGCGGDRDRLKRPVMGRLAAEMADRVVLTSDNPRSESPEAILREIFEGIPEDLRQKAVVYVDRREAIRIAVQDLQPGDVLVLAGKGHETYQITGSQKEPFDDREEARHALMDASKPVRIGNKGGRL